eukprot:15763697-Heterocapsa_arctica.AAC.1
MPTLTACVALPNTPSYSLLPSHAKIVLLFSGTSELSPLLNMCRSRIFVPAGSFVPHARTSELSRSPASGRSSRRSVVAWKTKSL